MKQANLLKKTIHIFLASFVAWFYCMVFVPLGYMYNSFPGKDAQVMLIAVLPGLFAMAGGLVAGALMDKIGRKTMVMISMVLLTAGGLMCRFVGESSLLLIIIGSGLTGFSAGSIPAVNLATLADIAPENMRDKVCGWCDAACLAGMFLSNIACGFLAADGNWPRAFAVYYLVVVVLVITIIWYPKTNAKKESAAVVEAVAEEETILPKSVIGLSVIIKFVSAFFYMGIGLFGSDFVINEAQIGTSAALGTISSIASIVGVFGSMLIFTGFKLFKGYIGAIALALCGVGTFLGGVSTSIVMFAIAWLIQGFTCNLSHSGYSTLSAMAPKGKAVATASGLFMAATFLGEALGGYVLPFLANSIFGNANASTCMRLGGIGCVVMAVICLPIFNAAYKVAFPKNNTVKEKV